MGDEVLHPHVLQICQTFGNNFLFQQDNASIPAIWQGTICKLAMSYPLDWLSGSGFISNQTPMVYSRVVGTRSYPFSAATFPEFIHYLVEQGFSWTEIYFRHFVQTAPILFRHLEIFWDIFFRHSFLPP